jgi:putative FmdB family regulatory protein
MRGIKIMPTYEYECKKCSGTFEIFQSMNDEPVKICPKCGGEVRRLINGGAGIIYRGSGFYSTDKAHGNFKADAKKAGGNKNGGAATTPPCAGCPHSDSSGSGCASDKAAG